MAKKTRTELSTLAVNTNLPDNTSEQITPTTERAQLTEERDSVINYKDDLGGTSNAGKFLTVGSDGESLTMVDEPSGVPDWVTFATAVNNLMMLKSGTTSAQIQYFHSDGTTLGSKIVYNQSSQTLFLQNNASGNSEEVQVGGGVLLRTGGTTRLAVTNAGDVGIGTASPSVKLEVHGSIRAVNSGTTTKHASINPDGLYIAGSQDGYLVSPQAWEFYAGNTKRMTIDSSGNIGAPSGSNIYSASDQRLKKNINTITEGLNKINNLNPINFNWIDGFCNEEQDKTLSGFVAQEVQNVIPEAVNSFTDDSIIVNGETIEEPLSVNEKLIIPYLVKAIQQLTARIETLENG